jgi:hypothetical protein
MDLAERRQLIKDLCANLQHYLVGRANEMPEDWDGFEIRELMADVARSRFAHRPMEGKRLREYRNIVLIKNLD